MSFTGFLFIILILMVAYFGLQKILKSKTIRIALISYREHLQQKKIEEEIQKSRQRTLDEIKNPDRVMEIILKIKRGEEVKIPLAAFDYIYRNMKKFSIVDKNGRITIINQEDYFKFKKEAMALLEKEKEDAIDARKILEQISQKVAENPIEITTYEDGTIVKIDHVSRTAEITKPNGESIFVDHKTETMVSQNLIEKTEQKTPAKDHEKDAQIKHTKEENLLLKGKIKQYEQKESRKEDSHVNSDAAPVEIQSTIDEEVDDALLLNATVVQNIENTPNAHVEVLQIKQKNDDFPFKKKVAIFDDSVSTKNENPVSNQSEPKIDTVQKELFPFVSIQAFLDSAVTFKSLHQLLKEFVIQNLESFNFGVVSNTIMTLLGIDKSTDTTLKTKQNNDVTHNSLIDNAITTHINNSADLNANKRCLGVIYDEKTSCLLINTHWIFLSLVLHVKEENIKELVNSFYSEPTKQFINNQTLTTILSHFNSKSSLALGSKIFMQEQKESTLINFKTIKIQLNETYYQGQYVFMFLSNSFCKGLAQELESIHDSVFRPMIIDYDSNIKAEKVTLKTFL